MGHDAFAANTASNSRRPRRPYSVRLFQRLQAVVATSLPAANDMIKVVLILPTDSYQQILTTFARNDSSHGIDHSQTMGVLPPWLRGSGVALLPNTTLIRTVLLLPEHVPSLCLLKLQHDDRKDSSTAQEGKEQQQQQHADDEELGGSGSSPNSNTLIHTSATRLETLHTHEELALEWNSPDFVRRQWLENNRSALTAWQSCQAHVVFPSSCCTLL